MASVVGKKKPLLYSDLFKSHGNSSSSSGSSHSSFSSGFTSPDFASSESEEGGDFIAELTRQMAECMLQEDDDEGKNIIKNCDCEEQAVAKQGPVWRGRRKKLSNRQRKQLQKAHRNYTPNSGGTGSGMQAVFLPGSGSVSGYGSGGTGVFLPRTGSTAGLPAGCNKKKSGCSMVLVPTRVLQVLDLHFTRIQDERRPTMNDDSGHDNYHAQLESRTYEDDEMQLPQEWSY